MQWPLLGGSGSKKEDGSILMPGEPGLVSLRMLRPVVERTLNKSHIALLLRPILTPTLPAENACSGATPPPGSYRRTWAAGAPGSLKPPPRSSKKRGSRRRGAAPCVARKTPSFSGRCANICFSSADARRNNRGSAAAGGRDPRRAPGWAGPARAWTGRGSHRWDLGGGGGALVACWGLSRPGLLAASSARLFRALDGRLRGTDLTREAQGAGRAPASLRLHFRPGAFRLPVVPGPWLRFGCKEALVGTILD